VEGERGYDKPLFVNAAAGGLATVTDTIFFEKSARMFVGDFGRAEDGRDIAREIGARMGPSLAIALPTFILGLFVTISFALTAGLLSAPRPSISGASCSAWRRCPFPACSTSSAAST
jgi:peptide/nickel transport system permease protein